MFDDDLTTGDHESPLTVWGCAECCDSGMDVAPLVSLADDGRTLLLHCGVHQRLVGELRLDRVSSATGAGA